MSITIRSISLTDSSQFQSKNNSFKVYIYYVKKVKYIQEINKIISLSCLNYVCLI